MAGEHPPEVPNAPGIEEPKWPLRQIEDALRGLRFGTVTIVVQDGIVIQLDRTEKRRLQRGGGTRR
jgi:hypothetical protein